MAETIHSGNVPLPGGVTSVFIQLQASGASGHEGNGFLAGAGGGGGAFASGVLPVTALTFSFVYGDGPDNNSNQEDGSTAQITLGAGTVLADGGHANVFPSIIGGQGGQASSSIGDFKVSGLDGGNGLFVPSPPQPGFVSGGGGNGAPPFGGAGAPPTTGDGTKGAGPGGGGSGQGSSGAGGVGGGGGGGFVRVWDNTNGTADGATNTPPTGGLGIIFEAGSLPATKSRKGAFIIS